MFYVLLCRLFLWLQFFFYISVLLLFRERKTPIFKIWFTPTLHFDSRAILQGVAYVHWSGVRCDGHGHLFAGRFETQHYVVLLHIRNAV